MRALGNLERPVTTDAFGRISLCSSVLLDESVFMLLSYKVVLPGVASILNAIHQAVDLRLF